jgi:threonine synthase
MLSWACRGCGATVLEWAPASTPFACPSATPGDDIDHVMRPVIGAACPFPTDRESSAEADPFVRYRHLLPARARAADVGLDDDACVRLVRGLDAAVAAVDGAGFRATPFSPSRALGDIVGLTSGELWVKDETRHVGGSHKARHLAGIMHALLVDERVRGGDRRPLAIASCGNAALAAAVVAKAAGWPIRVFVPTDANERVLERLRQLSASVRVCERASGVAGDPCYHAFRAAVAAGAIPFCCQGSDNGLAIDGGKTLAWEMVTSFRCRPAAAAAGRRLDAVIVQVGGGALASAVAQGFDDAARAGAVDWRPRFYTVQTTGAYPLKRAYDEVVERILARVPSVIEQGFAPASDRDRAALVLEHPDLIDETMAFARAHRSTFMRPWERVPRSIAHGILDDETYDWAAVVEGMLTTGGWPLVVSEDRLVEANRIARDVTRIDVDHTGSAGLAGLMKAIHLDDRLQSERVAVIFSGVSRS